MCTFSILEVCVMYPWTKEKQPMSAIRKKDSLEIGRMDDGRRR
jgi:hypothetical protein